MLGAGKVVREYLRVSKSTGDTDRSASTDQQHEENLRAIENAGWKLHPKGPYTDVDRSASRYSKSQRDGFKQLIADLEADTFDADILAIWESSRGSRRVGEWVLLIDLCHERGVHIWVTTHGRLYDPRNGRDRRSMHEDAVDSEYESSKTSERLRRTMRANAEAGRVHGKNLYGYRRVREYDPVKRKEVITAIVEDPDQAPIVKEAVRRVIAGDSYYEIAKDFNQRNIPIRREAIKKHNRVKGWTSVSIKQMIEMPAYRGLRQHTRDGKRELLEGTQWPPLITQEEWAQLEARFATDKNKWSHARYGQLQHMLSGIARCSICDSIVRVGKQNAGTRKAVFDEDGNPVMNKNGKPKKVADGYYHTYQCQGAPGRTGFHVSMRKEHLDDAITEVVLQRLEQPDFLARLGQKDDTVDHERQAVLDEIAGHRAWLEQVKADARERGRPGYYLDELEVTEPKIRDAQRRLEALVQADPEVIDLARSGAVRDLWEEMDLATRRRIISAVVIPVIKPVPEGQRGRRGINTDRIELIWK